jgi:hypothetical protein
MDILGKKVRDKVSGAEGVATSISFDLYGCIQVVVHPGVDKDGKQKECHWYDFARLTVLSEVPVMDQPEFEDSRATATAQGFKGPAEKPAGMKP